MMKTNWLIIINNSATDGLIIYQFYGTEKTVKELLLHFVEEDRKGDKDYFIKGTKTKTINDINDDELGELNAYTIYSNYCIEYTAIRLDKIYSININRYKNKRK